MTIEVVQTWPILSEDEDGICLGAPTPLHAPVPLFAAGDRIVDGIIVREAEYQRLNFGKLD